MEDKTVPTQADTQVPVAQPEGFAATALAAPVETTVTSQTIPAPTPVVSDRTTEQFEKLKDSNKKLFEANRLLQEELTRRSRSEQTFAPIQQTPPSNVPAPAIEQFVEIDPTTGEQYVNEKKLSTALAEANQKATRAETAVQNYIRQQNVLEEEKQTAEAYTAHPEINPSSPSFDANLSRFTSALLLHSMMNPQEYGGRTLTFKEAVDEAKKASPQQVKTQTAALEKETKEGMDTKQQATAGATGVSGAVAQQIQGPPQDELDTLRFQTRFGKGDDSVWAVAQRLSKISHTGTPTSDTTT